MSIAIDGVPKRGASVLGPHREPPVYPSGSRIWALEVFFVGVVVLQRFALPAGSSYVSPILPLALVLSAYLLHSRMAVFDRLRLGIYGGTIGVVLLSSAFLSVTGANVSTTSVGLLCAAYAPYCLRLRSRYAASYGNFLNFVSKVLLILAVIAIVQFFLQVIGVWSYTDLLAMVVPERLLSQSYVTSYPIFYGSEIYKPNSVLLLEPSFCSQFAALGLLLELSRRRSPWRLVVFAVALVTTFSGTGLILLAAGLCLLILERGPRFALLAGGVGVVVILTLAQTPVGEVYAARAGGSTASESSGNQRFIAPYSRYWENTQISVDKLILGNGAGFAQDQVERLNSGSGAPAIEPAHTKLLVEYGLLGGGLFLIFLVVCFTSGTRSRLLSLSSLLIYFILSAGLLQVQTIYLPWLLVILFAHPTLSSPWHRRRYVATDKRRATDPEEDAEASVVTGDVAGGRAPG